jgi:hypothetical protein
MSAIAFSVAGYAVQAQDGIVSAETSGLIGAKTGFGYFVTPA